MASFQGLGDGFLESFVGSYHWLWLKVESCEGNPSNDHELSDLTEEATH